MCWYFPPPLVNLTSLAPYNVLDIYYTLLYPLQMYVHSYKSTPHTIPTNQIDSMHRKCAVSCQWCLLIRQNYMNYKWKIKQTTPNQLFSNLIWMRYTQLLLLLLLLSFRVLVCRMWVCALCISVWLSPFSTRN